MSLHFFKADSADAVALTAISELAFDSDIAVGGAIVFLQGNELNVGRIFVSPDFFRKGYGTFIMQQIEESFSAVSKFTLDTPIWNVRTNSFYKKLGYSEVGRDKDFVYYEKERVI